MLEFELSQRAVEFQALDDRYGTHLVIRGADTTLLAQIAAAVMDAGRAIGETPEDLGLDADANA